MQYFFYTLMHTIETLYSYDFILKTQNGCVVSVFPGDPPQLLQRSQSSAVLNAFKKLQLYTVCFHHFAQKY